VAYCANRREPDPDRSVSEPQVFGAWRRAPMKIALFHNLPPGGAKRALFEHARHLRRRGHVLDAYTLAAAEEEFLPLGPLCRDLFVYPFPAVTRPVARRLADHPLAQPLWKGKGQRARQMLQACATMREQLRLMDALEGVYGRMAADIDAQGYDLVYVHHCRFLLAPYLLRRLGTPNVYFCQDTLRSVNEWAVETHPGYDSARTGFARRKFRGHLFSPPSLRILRDQEERDTANTRAATRVLANSWYSREAILRVYGVEARVCYLGVDSDFFTPDPSVPRENTVLSVGSLLPAKRHDFIVEAIAAIPPSRRPRMRIIGYDPSFGRKDGASMAEALLRLADKRGVDVQIRQEVSEEVLRNEYRRAAVLAFAPRLEPFGFVPLEAMACGTPVVGVCEGGVRETIQDGVTGLLTGRDAKEFGGALDRLLTDKALAAALAAGGREAAVCRWTWDRSVDTLERCFDHVVCRGRRPPEGN
jgi:glycosyltransferase involved in cell wall biosynthesis